MTRTPEYFDYPTVASEAGITPADLAAMEDVTRPDYPGDQMMFELRMLRTCRAIQEGAATVRDVLRGNDKASSSAV